MLDKVNWRTFVNEKLTGRKVNRWMMTGVQLAIGVAVSVAALRWANGATIPPLPGENIIILALPYVAGQIDNWIKSSETRSAIHANFPQVNPHGGPAAP